MTSDLSWYFNTAAPPPPPPDEGPGGPILVIAFSSNPFSRYYAEILRTEGLNNFLVMDISKVSFDILSAYDVVILGEMPLTDSQVSMLSNWVTAGGNLIATRPDKKLASLLGLTDSSLTLSDAYLLVNTSSGPGQGIVNQTIQFHGTADLYGVSSATRIATLYSAVNTATQNPAVTLKSVGSNGGQAAAFTYDLAKSVVYTRQGNPAWSGRERDGVTPIRSDDLFFGASEPDWIDLNKVAIPQADEQQRLLANLIIQMNLDKKPLPRFWYLPRSLPAVVVMTGDDHGSGGTAGRFEDYISKSGSNCSVENWACIRSTSYIYDGSIASAQAAAYSALGFEVSPHINTDCSDWTPSSLEEFYADQISQFHENYPNLPAPSTNRTHCIVWSDYDTQPQVELNHGVRFDTNYYYWPGSWLLDRPGFFTGSGMPMRFAKADGTIIDVYQATTQMTDESEQTFPYTIDQLLDKAIGTEGFYGVFTANMHNDSVTSSGSDAIIASAQSRHIPVISSRQMLQWLDGRNGSTISTLTWSGNTLNFTAAVGQNANGLTVMVPIPANLSVTNITQNGNSINYSTDIIKGIQYAFFPAASGSYQITFAADTIPPTVSSVSPLNGTSGVGIGANPTVTFSEAMDPATINGNTFELRDPLNALIPGAITYDRTTKTASFDPSGLLSASTAYTAQIIGGSSGVKDVAGNPMTINYSWSFATGVAQSSLWSNTTTPAVVGVSDPNAIELGVKFQSDVNGFITGFRFYKSAQNTGAHIGNLWTSSGALLASVPFANETAFGWQQVDLPSPVPITANTTYIASYHTAVGYYSADGAYFASSAFANPPLRALSNAEGGGNGVYRYGDSAFPDQTYNSTNYWVDVVFQQQ